MIIDFDSSIILDTYLFLNSLKGNVESNLDLVLWSKLLDPDSSNPWNVMSDAGCRASSLKMAEPEADCSKKDEWQKVLE